MKPGHLDSYNHLQLKKFDTIISYKSDPSIKYDDLSFYKSKSGIKRY